MKICTNFDDIRGKVLKSIEKILRKFLKNCSVLNICWNLEKKLFLNKFYVNLRILQDS